ncbi:MAG TPA: trigger factor [Bryobacteraceae bacterium]|nr:trigger factor [Bryobacteraceae bacterium]
MTVAESCKRSLEFSVPVEEVEAETKRVVSDVGKRAKLPGFRPGKVPEALLRRHFEADIRQQVLENLIPRHLHKRFEDENLNVVGTPDISDIHLHAGEPLRFKADFEVIPEIELGEYKGIEVPYNDPAVTDEDVDKRIAELREQKAEFVNVDPRPLADGDFAVLSLESVGGVEGEPVRNDEMSIEVGGTDTFEAFTENLRGMSPGEEKEFEVTYPEDYGQPRLAGKAVRFHAVVKGVRRKELPEVNDEFAQDLGDYRTLEELREAVRRSIQSAREFEAQRDAKNALAEKLVDMHEFPVPETLVERQIRNRVEQRLTDLAAQGIDPRALKLDWNKLKETQHEKALREVKASMLLSRVAERESIDPTRDEVDREVEKIAKQQREPFAAVRLKFEKDGTLGRIAHHIQTEKTLTFLFEHARKVATPEQA